MEFIGGFLAGGMIIGGAVAICFALVDIRYNLIRAYRENARKKGK